MITLAELQELTKRLYPDSHADLPHLLAAWSEGPQQNELKEIFNNTGFSFELFSGVLKPMLKQPDKEDRMILMEVIKTEEYPPLARYLWKALARNPKHRITGAFVARGIDLVRLRRNLNPKSSKQVSQIFSASPTRPKDRPEQNILLKFGRDLLAEAKDGAFDDLCDRPGEIDRILEVILRRNKRNPALTGPAGVGKTALVELLARMVARDELKVLRDYKMFELSTGKLVGGTRYRGDFEERMVEILDYLEKISPALLCVDELHTIVGAGRAEGITTDASNIIKPYLARNRICLVGATTTAEYQRYIAQGDSALARRFEEVRIAEPEGAICFAMIQAQAKALSEHHQISIPDGLITASIELTNRHLTQFFQPDKASTLLDSASANARRRGEDTLTIATLMKVLATKTGRPIEMLSADDKLALSHLSDRLRARIIGQNHAVEKVAHTLIYRRQDLSVEARPLGTFLFAGDTGVGKTELARVIAKEFFGDSKALLHLDLAEYADHSGLNKLIGAPVGYSGSDANNGVLIEWLHSKSSGVLLFDEIEKAAPEIHRVLLGLLDNGRITSARGETCDARQCIIILTTNAVTSSELIHRTVGFSNNTKAKDPFEVLCKHFPAEMLGRLDEIVVFNPLSKISLRSIMKLNLESAEQRLKQKRQVTLKYDQDQLLDWLLQGLAKVKTGARGIARLLENKLLQPVALSILLTDVDGPAEAELGESFFSDGKVEITPKPVDRGRLQ